MPITIIEQVMRDAGGEKRMPSRELCKGNTATHHVAELK